MCSDQKWFLWILKLKLSFMIILDQINISQKILWVIIWLKILQKISYLLNLGKFNLYF